eukprot:5749978-Ditylum_brightwellii.AAC.1
MYGHRPFGLTYRKCTLKEWVTLHITNKAAFYFTHHILCSLKTFQCHLTSKHVACKLLSDTLFTNQLSIDDATWHTCLASLLTPIIGKDFNTESTSSLPALVGPLTSSKSY